MFVKHLELKELNDLSNLKDLTNVCKTFKYLMI